jgi:hypothetical protein
MQEAVETGDTGFHTMVLFRVHGLVDSSLHRPVHAEYCADSYQRCAIGMLERHDPKAATVAWNDATACRYDEQLRRRCTLRASPAFAH